nr:hypothetical protein [Tanacetum cinerariifolium]
MTAGQRKFEGQWIVDERKAANLDQRLKSLIKSILLDDQMNTDINCLTAKSTWDDLESRVIKLNLCYNTFKFKEDFQDSLDDEEDTRSSQKYLNELEELYQARDLLAKSKRSFKKGTQMFRNAKATDQTECHKCGKKDDNEMVEVKVLMALAEDNDIVNKEGAKNGEWVWISMRKCISEQIPTQKKRILGVDQLIEDPSSSGKKDLVFIKSLADDTKVSIPGVERAWLSEAGGFIFPNHDTVDESSVYSTLFPPLKMLDGAEPVSRPKNIKSILNLKSTLKAEALKGVIINELSLAPARGNKSTSALKVKSAPAGKLKSVKIKDDPPLAIIIKELNDLKLQISKNQSSYSRNNHHH